MSERNTVQRSMTVTIRIMSENASGIYARVYEYAGSADGLTEILLSKERILS